jgi:hypothetical protein
MISRSIWKNALQSRESLMKSYFRRISFDLIVVAIVIAIVVWIVVANDFWLINEIRRTVHYQNEQTANEQKLQRLLDLHEEKVRDRNRFLGIREEIAKTQTELRLLGKEGPDVIEARFEKERRLHDLNKELAELVQRHPDWPDD